MQISEEKAFLERGSITLILDEAISQNIKIVAEGDSWFKYPLHKDIIDYLSKRGYAIKNCSKPGDTLENMVFNMTSFGEVLSAINLYRPKFFLLSGGGNDVVGQELAQYLNHKKSGLNPLRLENFKNNINGQVKRCIENYIIGIRDTDPTIHIIMHGYDYAKPNGTRFEILGFGFKGPWILPAFKSKGLTDRLLEQEPIIKELVDEFNNMLERLSSEHPQFHYIDLRGLFPNDSQWDNEIHLKSSGFSTVADKIHDKMVSILGANPLENIFI